MMYCIDVTNACTHKLPVMRINIALYHAWLTLRGRLASELSTRPPGSTFSLPASPLHDFLVIIMLYVCSYGTNISCRYYTQPSGCV